MAEPGCPGSVGPNQPILKSAHQGRIEGEAAAASGPTFDTPSYFWKMGTWFKLPLGYRNPWPAKESTPALTRIEDYKQALAKMPNKGFDPKTGRYNPDLQKRTGIDGIFAFWMPSKRYVERNRYNVTGLRPCEAGRPRPTDRDYVVEFQITWPFLPGSESAGATRVFRAAQERLGEGDRLFGQGGITYEHSLDGPISGSRDYFIYDDDGDLAVKMTCWTLQGIQMAPEPTCSGHIWQRSSDLVLYAMFPADKGQVGVDQLWREPVMAAIGLAKQWRWQGPGNSNE